MKERKEKKIVGTDNDGDTVICRQNYQILPHNLFCERRIWLILICKHFFDNLVDFLLLKKFDVQTSLN